MQDIRYDIFISSSHKDRKHPLIKKLIYILQSAGFLMWQDELNLKPGNLWLDQINEGIRESRYFIFILSKNTTKWSLHELKNAINHQSYRKDYFIIPVKLDDTPVPTELSELFFADLRNFNIAQDQIIQRILKDDYKKKYADFDIDEIQDDNSSIIQVTDQINEKVIEYYYTNPDELLKIDRLLFEKLIAELFDSFGYSVELTKQTRDGGKDIIAIKKDIVEVKYLIECKRPDPHNKISIQIVKNLYATKVDEKATKGILATTAFFTKDARLFFDRHRWELEPIDYNGIMEWLTEYFTCRNKLK